MERPHTDRVRTSLLLLVSVVATGCSQAGTQSSADCPDQVRVEDVVYTSWGQTERPANSHAKADQAECDDAGESPNGSVFPDDPVQVRTWTFEGYPPEMVLGIRYDTNALGVFIADTVPVEERERIYEDLSGAQP